MGHRTHHSLGCSNMNQIADINRGEACIAGKRSNRKKKEVQAGEVDALVEATEEGATVQVTKKKSRAKAVNKGPVFGERSSIP